MSPHLAFLGFDNRALIYNTKGHFFINLLILLYYIKKTKSLMTFFRPRIGGLFFGLGRF